MNRSPDELKDRVVKAVNQLQSGKLRESISALNELIEPTKASPLEKTVLGNLAFGHFCLSNHSEAQQIAHRVLSMAPNDVYVRLVLMASYANSQQHDKSYEIALSLKGEEIPLAWLQSFCQAVLKQGDYAKFAELGDIFQKLDTINPEELPNHIGINGTRNRVFGAESLQRYLALQQKWGEFMMAQAKAEPLSHELRQKAYENRNKDGRIRLGFFGLSDIFDTQKVLKPILEQLDRSVFDVRMAFIENGAGLKTHDSFTSMFEEVTVIPRGTNRSVAEELLALSCDILIDLNGLQQPATRVGAMAWRVAPLQLSWTGRPITCGLPELDYTIVDQVLQGDGEGTLNNCLAMPEAFACFGEMPDFPITQELPSSQKGFITFGVNSEPAKYNPETIKLWSDVLLALPNSKLVFIRPEYRSHYLRENISREFANYGIDSERIDYRYAPSSNREHMLEYNDIDVLLDSYPMPGGIGMLEVLYMGIPAVTLEGGAIQLRVGASHLHAAGLDDLRTESAEEYVSKAVGVAQDVTRRQELRLALRNKLKQTAFVDINRFGKGFDQTMKDLLKHPNLANRLQGAHLESVENATIPSMDSVTIDGSHYKVATMSHEAKAQLASIESTEKHLESLKVELKITQAARSAYLQSLVTKLPVPIHSDKDNGVVAIEGNKYSIEDFSDVAKQQLINVQACDTEIRNVNTRIAIANTAREVYSNALKLAVKSN
ncbi:hypothetical protein MAQ5080_00382 [Marinomonas aquimarina]|uniref:O-GlcNAc transferase C-terminal domain-containing protein n=1 Tax=Marinomonas aquimarina TaxID=295068 RepID=A0A1A8T2A9_9GAMM|nr:DUF6447 family protein [Marinomonas aquimarina]SBS25834.1 hypothetical protein MAQ5080_00382 [Marinomonas aquimarina]